MTERHANIYAVEKFMVPVQIDKDSDSSSLFKSKKVCFILNHFLIFVERRFSKCHLATILCEM